MSQEPLIVFCDGGSRGNPGPGSSGCVIKTSAGKTRFLCGKYLGHTTNNIAEYTAVKIALELITANYEKGTPINFFLDSNLVVSQLNGLYQVKNEVLRSLFSQIRHLEKHFGKVTYQHVPREQNKEADKVVNRVLDSREDLLEEFEVTE